MDSNNQLDHLGRHRRRTPFFRAASLAAALFLLGFASLDWTAGGSQPQIVRLPLNQWIQVSDTNQGARRHSSFRYASHESFFLQWGFIGYVTEFYGGPDDPPPQTPEYDLVHFDPSVGEWENHLPYEKIEEWSEDLPPLHMCDSYQGITTGSWRPRLESREGVLRPDLNIIFDQLAYDIRRNRMVYFTGGRTFAYDLQKRSWRDLSPAVSPPPVLGGSLVYDPVNDRIVLFGGGHIAETGTDGKLKGYTGTWVLNCSTDNWSPAESDQLPPPRMATRMVYDSRAHQIFLFGGDGHSAYLADTWILDPDTLQWSPSKTSGPPARAGHFTVYDPTSGWTVIGGGYNSSNLKDAWAYDSANDQWRPLKTAVPTGWYITADIAPEKSLILLTSASQPAGQEMKCNAIYSRRTTYAFRYELSALVGETESVLPQQMVSKRAPIPEADLAQAVDEQAQRTFLNEIANNTWTRLPDPPRKAPVRTWGSASWDSRRGRIVYWGGGHCGYGGSDYDFFDLKKNVWISRPRQPEYPERAWDKGINPAGVTFQGNPWIRHGRKAYAYDPVSDRIINMKAILLTAGYHPTLFPGDSAAADSGASRHTRWVTWTADPEEGHHQLLTPAIQGLDLTVNTPRGVLAINYDWGSLDTGNTPGRDLYDESAGKENAVYLLDVAAGRWDKLSGEQGPWPQNLYEMTALIYDSKRNRLVLHGAGQNRDELWSFSLDENLWTKIEPKGDQNPPVCRREAVYIASEDLLLTAGRSETASEPAFFAFHFGTNQWTRLDIQPPAGRELADVVSQNRALVYDPETNLVLMILGEDKGDRSKAVVYALRFRHPGA